MYFSGGRCLPRSVFQSGHVYYFLFYMHTEEPHKENRARDNVVVFVCMQVRTNNEKKKQDAVVLVLGPPFLCGVT